MNLTDDDVKERLNEYLREYRQGNRWMTCHANQELREYHRTSKQAEKHRCNEGIRNEEKMWCDGSGGGIEKISDEIAFLLFESTPYTGVDVETLARALGEFARTTPQQAGR